jgi:molybdate transport system substrate-binding protein
MTTRAPFAHLLYVGLCVALFMCVVACQGCRCSAREPSEVRVAAAASLSGAFEELGAAFEARTGKRVVFSFGASGALSQQLRQGAPFDVFAAADMASVDITISAGVCDGETFAPYARGQVALWSRRDAAAHPRTLQDLTDDRFKRVAIAQPEHAPYGKAAAEALRAVGAWDAVQPKLIFAENVRQALQLAQTGDADAALVALSLVYNDHDNPWTLVNEALHARLEQALVVCKGGQQRAGGEAFAAFVLSAQGRAIMSRHGFAAPGEPLKAAP